MKKEKTAIHFLLHILRYQYIKTLILHLMVFLFATIRIVCGDLFFFQCNPVTARPVQMFTHFRLNSHILLYTLKLFNQSQMPVFTNLSSQLQAFAIIVNPISATSVRFFSFKLQFHTTSPYCLYMRVRSEACVYYIMHINVFIQQQTTEM